jgi:hypothetical protein
MKEDRRVVVDSTNHTTSPQMQDPAFRGRRGGGFGRCYRELAYLQGSLMRRVSSESLESVRSIIDWW